MLKITKQIKHLHFILLVFNYSCRQFTTSIQYMTNFFFLKNFALHVGIVFTYYDHEYQIKINKKRKKDPKGI